MQTRFFQASACANSDARQGLFGDRDGEASFRLQAAIDAAQKRAATDEHQSSLHHIRRQLRGCALERRPNGFDDALERKRECVPYLVGGDHCAPKQTGDQVASPKLGRFVVGEGPCGSDPDLDRNPRRLLRAVRH